MFEDIIEYGACEEAGPDYFGFSSVTFLRDFGPWAKGDKVDLLWFNLEKATVEDLDVDGNAGRKCGFKLEPK